MLANSARSAWATVRKFVFLLIGVVALVVFVANGPLVDRHGPELRRLGRCLRGEAAACEQVHLVAPPAFQS